MGRASTRGNYTDGRVLNHPSFTHVTGRIGKARDLMIFTDWINGMTGIELAKKYDRTDTNIRRILAKVKHEYVLVRREIYDDQ